MVQSVKQCAGCGTQMGLQARVCPHCGRGSLLDELLWIAILGVLLLGIAVLSGLVPLDRIREVTPQSAVNTGGTSRETTHPAKPKIAHGGVHKARPRSSAAFSVESSMGYAPCAEIDTQEPPRVETGLARGPRAAPASTCPSSPSVTPNRAPTPADTSVAPQH